MTTDIIIKGCDKKFADMVINIHRAYSMKMKCGIQINFSGNPNDFNYIYLNVHPDNAAKLIQFETLEAEKE